MFNYEVDSIKGKLAGGKYNCALLEQIRTIDKSRLIRKIGRVPEEKMKEIGAAIHVSLDLNDEDEQHIDASG